MIYPLLYSLLFILFLFAILEILLHIWFSFLRKRFAKIITKKDLIPSIDPKRLEKFIEKSYDSELGWIRKPNTSKIEDSFGGDKEYSIDGFGSRSNPGFEGKKKKIITFGDSFTFCREVNDNETWQHFLSKKTNTNVMNFGVGNYGLDQAFIRFKRESSKIKESRIAIMGVVPETIQRNLTIWKHYSEFGNVLGFKPRFMLSKGKLKLIKNPIDNPDKFSHLKDIIPTISKYDHFYEDFNKKIFSFPYIFSIMKNPRRNVPLVVYSSVAYFFESLGINWRKLDFIPAQKAKNKVNYELMTTKIQLYRDEPLCNLTLEILKEIKKEAEKRKIRAIFVMMPQREDLEYIQANKESYYNDFIKRAGEVIDVLDLSPDLLKYDFKNLFPSIQYSKNFLVFGGHYSPEGNEIVAEIINKFIKEKKIKI